MAVWSWRQTCPFVSHRYKKGACFNEMDLTREIPEGTACHFRSHGERLRVRLRARPAQHWPGKVKAGVVGYPVIIIPC